MRLSSFTSYMDTSDIEEALTLFRTADIVDVLLDNSTLPFNEIWQTVECLTVNELKELSLHLFGKSNKPITG